MANNKDFEKDFKLPDTKALSEAYTEYLDSVTFGGKPIGEEKKKPEAVSMAKVDETEKSSTVHDEIVEKIVRKNKALSHSIWTDEPVLKPKKSVWLNTDDDNEEALKTVDIKEIDRDSLPKYKDLISELDSRKSNKMEVLLNHSDNPYVYEDMGYVVKSVFNAAASLSYIDCTKQLVAKKAGLA